MHGTDATKHEEIGLFPLQIKRNHAMQMPINHTVVNCLSAAGNGRGPVIGCRRMLPLRIADASVCLRRHPIRRSQSDEPK